VVVPTVVLTERYTEPRTMAQLAPVTASQSARQGHVPVMQLVSVAAQAAHTAAQHSQGQQNLLHAKTWVRQRFQPLKNLHQANVRQDLAEQLQ